MNTYSCPGQCSCKLLHFCMVCGECSSSDLQRYQVLEERVFDSWQKTFIQKHHQQRVLNEAFNFATNTGDSYQVIISSNHV